MKQLSIGGENFADLIRDDCYYVDKTGFIQAVMESSSKVLLITRPRRFGKTLFMDTMKTFLQLDWKHPRETTRHRALFAGLRILREEAFCQQCMGQYPVISLSLKDIDGQDYAESYASFADVLKDKVSSYRFLLDSPRLDEWDKAILRNYLTDGYLANRGHETEAKSCLKNLAVFLAKHFETQVVLLIDEYDVPLVKAAQFGYYGEMLKLIRTFLGQILKEPTQGEFDASAYVEKAVLTGCLQVGTESIFAGINNIDKNTVVSDDRTLSGVIGFNAAEVQALLAYYGLTSRWSDVKRRYDGYRFAESNIYCPWDVINFCDKARKSPNPTLFPPGNYWADTSENKIITEFLGFLTPEDAVRLQTLLDGGTVDITTNEKLTYGDLTEHHSEDFWTLLLFTGYLTVAERLSTSNAYRVRIPNIEIRDTFEKKVRAQYSTKNRQYARYGEDLAAALLSGDADAVRRILLPLLKRYVSVRDEATKAPPENYYHGFLSAMLICAGDAVTELQSNAEAGCGYADLVLTSPDMDTGVVIEVKRCSRPEIMAQEAQAALDQIKAKRYAEVFEGYQCPTCYGFGIAFSKKLCVVKVGRLSVAV